MEVKEEKQTNQIEKNENIIKGIPKLPAMIVIIVLVVILILVFSLFQSSKNRLTITTTSTLKKIIEINDLSTVDYTYNAIVTKYKDDTIEDEDKKKERSNVEYYVSYEGVVTAGIDFNEITVSIDDKVISINLPEPKINETRVDMGTLEYIMVNRPQESEAISQEAYKLCQQDLRARATEENEILKGAKDNAKSAIKALLEPWIESVSDEYKVEIK